MKHFLATITVLLFVKATFASHIIGGEMRYQYISPGLAPDSKIFKITLILFKGDAVGPNVANLDPTYIVAIYNNDNNQKFPGLATSDNWIITRINNPPDLVPIIFPACILGAPEINYTYGVYTMTVELPNTQKGYTVVYQTCCRINGIMNVGNSIGSTYSCSIPGTDQIGNNGDTSPSFGLPINVICKNAPFTLNFGATDPDPGDSLVYSLCEASNGGGATGSPYNTPSPPPYGPVTYTPPFTSDNPLGTFATINPNTGLISGIAPDFGKYVICVCIAIYHNGLLIATHSKDLIVQVSDCSLTVSNPMPNFVTCDGFNVQFSQNSTGANSIFWDLGDPATQADTSIISDPTYTYADTGTYIVKLVINRGTGCADSTYRKVGVYPGFFPNFSNTGICITNPVRFNDLTTTNYGIVSGWTWNFGDASTLDDTSHVKNPEWTYSSSGPKNIILIVTSSKGCIDTATQTVTIIDKPPITLGFRDTLICKPDAVQLLASGMGVFSWTPPTNIINANTSTPTVNPTATTWYHVRLDEQNCINTDSVKVRVVDFVSLKARIDTTICLTDAVQLSAVSDGLRFVWSPGITLNDSTLQDPVATPTGPTPYRIIAYIGSCKASDDVTISTIPYPKANAGGDTIICYNTPAQLHGSHDGSSFTWSPVNSLQNFNTLNPTAFPPGPGTIPYVLSVLDNRGCPKPGRDTIWVTVLPKIVPYAGHDTVVVVSQPLQFNAQGGVTYQWIPATGLNNSHVGDPVGIYGASIDSVRYTVLVFNSIGCLDSSHVTVRVFKTLPSVFVPTAFTPNGDGINDVVLPIAVGVKQIDYFNVYNRWGQLVFTTTINGHGWDGKISGTLQGSNVFVWMVKAVDYLGKPIFLKGTVTLIR
jgi:gliding motility-associated-like protein